MPFKSDEQRRYLEAEKPEVAKKFEEHESMAGRALRSMKDFVSGASANRKAKERLQPPTSVLGVRG